MVQTAKEKAIHAKKGIKPNPKFKRLSRKPTAESEVEISRKITKELNEKARKEREAELRRKKQEADERKLANRPRDEHGNVIGLGELTDKKLREGLSEDDAFREAKEDLGIR